ncbi:hypothetical protein TcCL_ESM09172, partial [Trypanosoma cruzi]
GFLAMPCLLLFSGVALELPGNSWTEQSFVCRAAEILHSCHICNATGGSAGSISVGRVSSLSLQGRWWFCAKRVLDGGRLGVTGRSRACSACCSWPGCFLATWAHRSFSHSPPYFLPVSVLFLFSFHLLNAAYLPVFFVSCVVLFVL